MPAIPSCPSYRMAPDDPRRMLCVVSIQYMPNMRDIAEDAAAAGWQVTALRAVPRPAYGREGERTYPLWRFCQAELLDGVTVLNVLALPLDRRRALGRLLVDLSFALSAWLIIAFRLRHAVLLLDVPPLLMGVMLQAWAHLRHQPCVVSLQDLTGLAAQSIIFTKRSLAQRVLAALERWLSRTARHLVTISDRMADEISRSGRPRESIHVVQNWCDTRVVTPQPQDNAFSRREGLTDRFVVLHAGTIGLKQSVDAILGAAARLRDLPDLVILFVGSGVARERAEREAQQRGLSLVRFLPFQPWEDVPLVYAAADVCLVTLGHGMSRFCVPSKAWSILCAGRPMIVAADPDGETAAVVAESGAGLVVSPDDAEALAQAIRWCYEHRQELPRMGNQARAWAEHNLDRGAATRSYLQVVECALST